MESKIIFREAISADIPQLQRVRHLVKENILSDPSRVTDEDSLIYISIRGKGWVCEIDRNIVGFAIADLKDENIWALFIDPEYEDRGIGKTLHKLMLDWYFSTGKEMVWLSTDPDTRAAEFYRRQGWRQTGFYGNEIKFEMIVADWQQKNNTL